MRSLKRQIMLSKKIDVNYSDLTLCIPLMNKDINNSAILRTAHVFGVKKVYIIGNKKIITSHTAGAHNWINIIRVPTYKEVFGLLPLFSIIVGDSNGDIPIQHFIWPSNPILFVGNEGGVPDIVLKRADFRVKIPQFGLCDSLNVGNAAAILLFHHRQQFESWRK